MSACFFPNPTEAFESLSGASGTGPGSVLDSGCFRSIATMLIEPLAGVTAGQIVLEGSWDGSNWLQITSENSWDGTTNLYYIASSTATRYLRANIITALTGGTVNVYVLGLDS